MAGKEHGLRPDGGRAEDTAEDLVGTEVCERGDQAQVMVSGAGEALAGAREESRTAGAQETTVRSRTSSLEDGSVADDFEEDDEIPESIEEEQVGEVHGQTVSSPELVVGTGRRSDGVELQGATARCTTPGSTTGTDHRGLSPPSGAQAETSARATPDEAPSHRLNANLGSPTDTEILHAQASSNVPHSSQISSPEYPSQSSAAEALFPAPILQSGDSIGGSPLTSPRSHPPALPRSPSPPASQGAGLASLADLPLPPLTALRSGARPAGPLPPIREKSSPTRVAGDDQTEHDRADTGGRLGGRTTVTWPGSEVTSEERGDISSRERSLGPLWAARDPERVVDGAPREDTGKRHGGGEDDDEEEEDRSDVLSDCSRTVIALVNEDPAKSDGTDRSVPPPESPKQHQGQEEEAGRGSLARDEDAPLGSVSFDRVVSDNTQPGHGGGELVDLDEAKDLLEYASSIDEDLSFEQESDRNSRPGSDHDEDGYF